MYRNHYHHGRRVGTLEMLHITLNKPSTGGQRIIKKCHHKISVFIVALQKLHRAEFCHARNPSRHIEDAAQAGHSVITQVIYFVL